MAEELRSKRPEAHFFERRYKELVMTINNDTNIHKDWREAANLELHELTADLVGHMIRRPQRLAVIGERGAGKSSLINALLKKDLAGIAERQGNGEIRGTIAASEYLDKDRGITYFDCVGHGDGDNLSDSEVLEKNFIQWRNKLPDILLFLIPAEKLCTDSNWTTSLRLVTEKLLEQQKRTIPVVLVVTKCDIAEGLTGRAYTDDTESNEHLIQKARDKIKRDLPKVEVLNVVATVTKDNTSQSNVAKLIDILTQGNSGSGAVTELARRYLIREIPRVVARRMTQKIADYLYRMAYIPSFLYYDSAKILLRNQEQLVRLIKHLSGFVQSSTKVVTQDPCIFTELLTLKYGAERSGVGTWLLRAIPGVGGAISGHMAWKGTRALGEAAIVHYFDRKDLWAEAEAFQESLL